jgi:hypothetical protein
LSNIATMAFSQTIGVFGHAWAEALVLIAKLPGPI